VTSAPALSPLEIATGMVFGTRAGELPESTGVTPLQAMEEAILPALLREPCLVSFSGGRDSSAVLAVATALARREGLALPVPASNLFPAQRETDETRWQERMVRHLDLEDWVRIEHTTELDAVGPYACRLLAQHGLLWPFNVYFHCPLLQVAAGGSLLTGVGGDELFGAATRDRLSVVMARQARPEARDLLHLGFGAMPRFVRRAVLARRVEAVLPWLRPAAQQRLLYVLADAEARIPRRLKGRMTWTRMSRYLDVGTAALAMAAEDEDVRIVHPLLATPLWAEVGRVASPVGFSGRTEGMRRIFGALLPDEICARAGKARFDGAMWTDIARAHARSWDGGGVPPDAVDERALAAHWRTDRPMANSFTLLQASWLSSVQGVEEQPHALAGPVPAARSAQLDEGKAA
jgi:Asparagine synthase